MATAVRGEHGWIPLPQFMEKAAAVGFVDFDSPAIPLIEEYRGVAYKSLVLCCVEFAMDSTARVTPRGIQVGGGVLPVDELSIFRATIAQPDVQYMSFADLVSDRAELSRLERRVVIIGWDSDKTPVIMTEHGKMTIHRFFVACVATAFHAAKG